MSKAMNIFLGALGLNNKTDPARLDVLRAGTPQGEIGLRWLDFSVNGMIDGSGRWSRSPGYSQLVAGNFKQVWSDKGAVIAVKSDGGMYLVGANGALTLVHTLTNAAKDVAFVQTPLNDAIYFTNGLESGYIEGGTYHAWEVETPPAAWAYRDFADTVPAGSLLEYFDGFMCVARENVVWVSERGYPGLFRLGRGYFAYPSPIRMMKAVGEGLWVGDGDGIYFLRGDPMDDMALSSQADYPVNTGACLKIDSDLTGIDQLMGTGEALLFWTTKGLCAAGGNGMFLNLTRNILETEKPPSPLDSSRGAATTYGDNMIATFEY